VQINSDTGKLFTLDCGEIFLREFQIEDSEKIQSLTTEPDISKFLPDWRSSREQIMLTGWVRWISSAMRDRDQGH